MTADSREQVPDDADIPSVDVCGRCGDPYCDGIACIAELDPDARDDREAVEEVQDLIRLGRAWQIMERHGLPAAVRALGHAGYATPLRSAAGGAELIAAERQRQVTAEGWTPEHDDEHGQGELAGAAVCYVVHALHQDDPYIDDDEPWPLPQWPWGRAWWKPSGDPIRNLVKAGALIAAEIDRLQRREEPGHGD